MYIEICESITDLKQCFICIREKKTIFHNFGHFKQNNFPRSSGALVGNWGGACQKEGGVEESDRNVLVTDIKLKF